LPAASATSHQPLPQERPRRPRPRAALAAALLAGLGIALGGCGSSSPGGTSADPADAVPASAVLYAGATVRPTGAEQSDALAAGKALTHQADPYLRLLGALQTPGSAQLNFKRDVATWLGPKAGAFLTSPGSTGALSSLLAQGLLGASGSGAFAFGASGAQGAIVLDTSNTAKARSFLSAQAAKAGAHAGSYKGVSYEVNSSGVAFGLVDRFAVIGSESGLHAVIETTRGGSSLAHAGGYAKLLAAAPSDALAHIYANPAGFAASSGQEGLTGLLQGLVGGREANVSLTPSPSSLSLDADTLESAGGGQGGLLAADPESAQALGELPGESWLAIGLGHVGSTLARDAHDLQALTSLGSTLGGGPPESTAGLSISGLVGGLITPLRALGADTPTARRDFDRWMGSAGIFAAGSNLLELKGAVVISSKDPGASRAAVAELAAQLRKTGTSVTTVSIPGTEAAAGARITGLPVVLDIADGRDSAGQSKFVLGIGEASVEAALDPPSTLSVAAPRTAAAASLGEGIQPSLIASFPTFLTLLEGIGLSEDPSISKLVPYLRSSTTLAGGGRALGGGVDRFRLVLGLQAAGG
jgi:hypothetical protein